VAAVTQPPLEVVEVLQHPGASPQLPGGVVPQVWKYPDSVTAAGNNVASPVEFP